jgi:hypothetical protein
MTPRPDRGDLEDGAFLAAGLLSLAVGERERIEARISDHLLYTKGWPTCIPSRDEAEMLCEVRAGVAAAVGLQVGFTDPGELIARYEELYAVVCAKRAA